MGRRIEASAVVPMGREETWDLLEGDRMRRAVELSDAIVAIEDYQMRPDGTPRYVYVRRMGPGKVSSPPTTRSSSARAGSRPPS